MKKEQTTVDIDFAEAAVPQYARRGIVTMFMIMLGFTFFSASMWVGQELADGLDFGGFLVSLIIGGHPLHEPFESILFKLPVHPAACQGILSPSAQVRRGPVPWSVWSLLLCQPQRKPSFWRLSRWLCRRF